MVPDARGAFRGIRFRSMKQDTTSPRSVARLLGLLDTMAREGDALTLSQLSLALDSPKSSLLLMLRPLVEQGYLMHTGSAYRLGPGEAGRGWADRGASTVRLPG